MTFKSPLPPIEKVSMAATRNFAKNASMVTDYIILGGGSAGCVLANRLSEKSNNNVTLLEAGSGDRNVWDWWKIHMPAALTYNLESSKYNWMYSTTKQEGLNGRSIGAPRGKVLGGSSSINAMVYIRGNKEDFNRWANEEGATGWSYEACLPYFLKSQTHADMLNSNKNNKKDTNVIDENSNFENEKRYKGIDGPLHVKTVQKSEFQDLFDVFVQAGLDAGYPYTSDMNGENQQGFGPMDMTIAPNGERCNTANAYLKPIVNQRQNLKIQTNSHVNRIIFDDENNDVKPKAVGVEYFNSKTKAVETMYARKEIISSLGAVGSPTLLLRSGIGNGEMLKAIGCENVIVNNPHVGQNLQDHTEVYLQYKCKKPITLYPLSSWSYARIKAGLEWFLFGTGICSSNLFHTGGFICTDPKKISHPDIQYHFIPGAVIGQSEFLPIHAFQVHVGTLRPKSQGYVTINSMDPNVAPIIDPQYYKHPNDIEDMRIALRHAENIVSQPAFSDYRAERLSPPGINIMQDDEAVDKFIRENTHSAYHLSCTCKMGDEENGPNVVNTKGQVYGVDNLRVVDASIFPSMTSGNLNAPTIMVAEKMADIIKTDDG